MMSYGPTIFLGLSRRFEMKKSGFIATLCLTVLVAVGCRSTQPPPMTPAMNAAYPPSAPGIPTSPYAAPASPGYASSPYAAPTGQPYGNPAYPPSAGPAGYAASSPAYTPSAYPAPTTQPYAANPYQPSAGPSGYTQPVRPAYERSSPVSDTFAIPRATSSSSSGCPSGCNNH